MRLPLPFLLYVVALGLFGWAGWTFYETLPLWQRGARDAASKEGIEQSVKLLARGKGQGAVSADWHYENSAWWQGFKAVNLVGKLPEKPKTPDEIEQAKPKAPPVDMRPLEEIIELVSLVYDGQEGGKGGSTHVIVRYKPEADVEPPEWWVRENMAPTAGGGRSVMPRDLATPALTSRPRSGNSPPSTAPTTSMPTSLTGREFLQKIWIADDGDPRHGAHLWPRYSHIRLVRVASDAQSAFFVREVPPSEDGQPVPEPVEEELLKTLADIPQDVLLALRQLQGREGPRSRSGDDDSKASNAWREVDETTRFGNEVHIGRKDEQRFRESADDFFEKVYVDTYRSRSSDLRGLSVRNVEPQLASRFGVATGDVLVEINGRSVESKAQAINMVKGDYNRGVRSFATKWLSNGQMVERVYQAPDR